MALCSRIKVKLLEKGKKIHIYVYHMDSYFRNERGIPTHKKRSIGKFDTQISMLIPNETYYEIYENQNEVVEQEQ